MVVRLHGVFGRQSGLPARLRAFRMALAFGFQASPWDATLVFVANAVRVLAGLAAVVGLKLLADAAFRREPRDVVVAAAAIALALGVQHVGAQAYLRLTIAVIEKAGVAIDRHLMALTAGIVGLEHHERPEYLDQMDLIHWERDGLGYMTNATVLAFMTALDLVGSAFLLARLHPALLLLPVFAGAPLWAGRRAEDLEQQAREATTETQRLKQDLFDLATSAAAGKEVRVFGLAPVLLARHAGARRQIIGVRRRAAWRGAVYGAAGSLVFAVGYVGAVALVLLRAAQGLATPGDVLLAVTLAAQMNGAVQGLASTTTQLVRTVKLASRYLWLVDYAERASRARPAPVTKPASASLPANLAAGITIERLSFRYPGTAVPALADVSLCLPAGSIVALVGENGAGKTTLVKLLCRLYEPESGSILVDGTDLRRFDVQAWRVRLCAVFQDFCRFEFRARDAVGIGDLQQLEVTSAVEHALARAGAADVVSALPDGLETQLGSAWPGGVDVSGGQWQKLALARALIRRTPLLLILDEPTTALDPHAEHALFERFAAAARNGKSQGAVTLLISHRFSTVRLADHIVVLDQGRVVEQGSHANLIRRRGLYAELYGVQASAYR
ncbi:MAG: ABC transporter ATP-binding protein [Chloroflexi bacterium]|nr:ABC transporter ATP-binding protein [Chloroflexota bacterium]